MKNSDETSEKLARALEKAGVVSDVRVPTPDPLPAVQAAFFCCFPHLKFSDWRRESRLLSRDPRAVREQSRKFAAWCTAAIESERLCNSKTRAVTFAWGYFTAAAKTASDGQVAGLIQA